MSVWVGNAMRMDKFRKMATVATIATRLEPSDEVSAEVGAFATGGCRACAALRSAAGFDTT